MIDPRLRSRYTEVTADPCPNPDCPRAWHGLPVRHINGYWRACPGSWSFEHTTPTHTPCRRV